MKKYLLAFLTVWIVGLCIGLVGASIASLKKNPRKEAIQSKWYGGKPRPPIEVSISPLKQVTPNSEVDVEVLVTPKTSCTQISVQIRGLHGVVALEPTHGVLQPCSFDSSVPFIARIRVPAETSGALVADIAMDTEDGRFSYSQSAPVSSSDASAPYKVSSNSMGNLKTGPQGDVVREMKADEKIN